LLVLQLKAPRNAARPAVRNDVQLSGVGQGLVISQKPGVATRRG